MRVIDATTLFKAAHPDTPFSAAFANDEWNITLGKDSIRLSPLDTTTLFFGPLPTNFKKPWSDYFPLPLWLWGLDAV